MSALEGYRVNSTTVDEVYRAEDREGDAAQLKYPFSERFLKKMRIEILESSEDELTFDLIGVDASIANALRRIMLSEVPTVAIEQVYIEMNSSLIHDEVLAHRLGLVPINVDPRLMAWQEEEDGSDETNTLVFSLDVSCKQVPEGVADRTPLPAGSTKPYTMGVYARDLAWHPQGDQEATLQHNQDGKAVDGKAVDGKAAVAPMHPDILLAKLRPGQSIKLEAHCQKGVGKDHAKFSPVATASYRLLPKITLNHEKMGGSAEAQALKDMCPRDVFDIEDLGAQEKPSKKKSGKGKAKAAPLEEGAERKKAVVARPRDCSMCRECIRHDGWSEKVHLGRAPDHFIFKVESVGALQPKDIVKEAIAILKAKCASFLSHIDEASRQQPQEPGDMDDDDDDDAGGGNVAEML